MTRDAATAGLRAFVCVPPFLFVLFFLLVPDLAVGNRSAMANAQDAPEGSVFAMTTDNDLLIDDFASGDGISRLGTSWRCFTDQVMGGRSRAEHSFTTIAEHHCLLLRGEISLANNGGFIQVALPLDSSERSSRSFDASDYDGIRLWVRGKGDGYYVHLRNEDTRLPWQYYQAPLECRDQWQLVTISFQDFRPQTLDAELDVSRLTRIAIVAAKQEFSAEIAVSQLKFYRSTATAR